MIQTMMTRQSNRSFTNASLAERREVIDQILRDSKMGPLGHPINLLRLSPEDLKKEGIGSLASFGIIKGTADYLFAIVPTTRAGQVNYGYAMEKAALALWKEGIGSCWLGGTFKRQKLESLYMMKATRSIPAILAIGMPEEEPSLVERVVKLTTRPINRKPLSDLVFDRDFHQSLVIKPDSKWEAIFTCVQRAPSARNAQPWRIVREYNTYHFYLRTREETTLNRIDMGVAICHFDLARMELGVEGSWRVIRPVEDPDHKYFISFVKEKENE
jgi:nitroreductase